MENDTFSIAFFIHCESNGISSTAGCITLAMMIYKAHALSLLCVCGTIYSIEAIFIDFRKCCFMFEVITYYDKDVFCKCYKVHYKIHSKYNAKRNIFLMIMCFIMATIALLLGIAKPETFHTIYAVVFFYISSSIFLLSLITMSDQGIKRRVDKIFSKNPNMDLVAKYVFNEENFIAIKGKMFLYIMITVI